MAIICRLSRSSIADLLKIDELTNRPAWNENSFEREFLSDSSEIFGARMDGRLVGYLVCHFVIDEAHIVNFGVLPQFQGMGIGRDLLTYVLYDLFERGARVATLEVRANNLVAIALYHSLGFQEAGIRERYYSDNAEDALLLKLDLILFREILEGNNLAAGNLR